ncbi:hypothetical protein [Mucilaginibacter lappiensis]|uniref:Uncharacterized protein n=1 Tax=Mucilaginibacter lappiensis TaxID=354630 RepID=A0A1N7AYQ0_9SPHI|nr:hypothetical protein [Mucilaginibacter lappiensis]MBB6110645.1 hypothetical protein [Mucilaginibacter lappiensis]MBB6128307.1 hypothetical protein [Mucilaginibacter lappiensis]SIR44196.1 hypothetical protein SAMN05421821_107168 [Mucilaginibacter lappiensis]
MKLKFKISQTTSLAPEIIIDRIKAELDQNKYRVLNITNNSVKFDESPWKLMWNFEAMRRLDGGKFDVNLQDNLTSVTFSYYRSLIGPLIILTVISIGLIRDGEYYAPLGFLLFYVIALTFNAFTLKDVANEMLNDILIF